MAYETIPITVKDAGRVHMLTGIVTDTGDGTADVDIDNHGVVSDIPTFYHCPDSETADGSPFSVDDRVLVVNSGSGVDVANMKVIGFEDGLPRECCFSDPFTEADFTWVASKAKIGDALLSYITEPTGPLNFATAFDKPALPGPDNFRGGGVASYKIENLDLPLCNYFIFKLSAVNIVKDLTGWSKACYGSIGLAFNISSVSKTIEVGFAPGLYYKDISVYKEAARKLNTVIIASRMYTECHFSSLVHHEVNMTFDYIKMSNEIPAGGIEV